MGGPGARHQSPGAAELTWCRVFPGASLAAPAAAAPRVESNSSAPTAAAAVCAESHAGAPAAASSAPLPASILPSVAAGSAAPARAKTARRPNSEAGVAAAILGPTSGAGSAATGPSGSGPAVIEGRPAPMCTTWDPFHRVDNAVWRAIRAVPRVLNIFDVAKEMSHLFGMSEGTHELKAVAADCRETLRTVKAPGGTRKVVYVSGVPGSLLDNYALY